MFRKPVPHQPLRVRRKIALGHHFDDVVETFMLNLFYEGRLGAFQPVTYLSRMDVTLIRPMIYAPEKDIRYFARRAQLPVLESKCPANGKTERESMKQLLRDLDRSNKGLRHRIFGAMQKAGIDGYKEVHMNLYDDPEPLSAGEEDLPPEENLTPEVNLTREAKLPREVKLPMEAEQTDVSGV